jgi:aspartyl-tRNA(Asn)/glutamyl-tRNA(Gln) amidotransferase subunit B
LVEFETIIGLEVHAQVLTATKMFCSCTAESANLPPNSAVCPVCLGMPGVLPTVNRAAVEKTVMTGLALGCEIPRFNRFDRKNYMYPDLMKGYQISQYELPMAVRGELTIGSNGDSRRIGITRVHLEEDTARLLHRSNADGEYSLVDVNRGGIPLMEIVSDPDLRSPEEARHYLVELRRILRYIDASSGNMEEGAFRCDANISIRALDGTFVGPKVEIKNMNSFRAVERALIFEAQRQRGAVANGERLVQETRGWVDTSGVTVSQREKEFADDYRYFPEPDLPPLELEDSWVAEIRARMPELPAARRSRFEVDYGLSATDAALLTDDSQVAAYFEEVVQLSQGEAREVANWVTGELFALARTAGGFEQVRVTPSQLAELIDMTVAGEINLRTAKDVLAQVDASGRAPREVVDEQGLRQVSDDSLIRAAVADVIAEHPKAVADFKGGKRSALGFLMGQVMQRLRGAGHPDTVRHILEQMLDDQT